MTQATHIKVTSRDRRAFELDGGARKKTSVLRIHVVPHAVTIRVPLRASGVPER
jgi:diacylglycerol kinase family enzyme